MGSSYGNLTLRAERHDVVRALQSRDRTAYVGPTTDGFTVVFDEEAEDDEYEGTRLAAELTRELGCPGLLASVYDEDVFSYSLFRDGELLDEYASWPGYPRSGTRPSGGDAALLARVLGGKADSAALADILGTPAKEGRYRFETRRHGALARALGLPDHAVGNGYRYIWEGDAEELEDLVVHLGSDEDEDEDEYE